MNQFVFEGRQKTFLMSLMGLGVVCMAWTYIGDTDELHTRFWTNFLHNSVFFTGIAFMATFMLAAKALANSGWQTVIKRLWESYALFLGVGLCLMGVLAVGVLGDFHHLYHWADADAVATDKILKGKSAFLNPIWYSVATFGFIGLWYWFARQFRSISLEQDEQVATNAYPLYTKMKRLAAIFLPIAGFTSAAAIWQWIMSVDAHWYSTMFAWYTTASWLVSMFCMTVLMLIYLKSKGYFREVTLEHFHDLGKFVFGFSVFWTYLWFSQYMLIWYANIGEETIYFRQRRDNFYFIFSINLILNFVLPFLILIRNDSKRKMGIMAFMCSVVFFGHWLDFFQMTKYGPFFGWKAHEAAHHAAPAEGNGHEHSDATIKYSGNAVAVSQEVGKQEGHAKVATKSETEGAHAEEAHTAAVDTAAVNVAPTAAHAEGAESVGHTETAHHEGGAESANLKELKKLHERVYYGFVPGFTIPGFLEIGTFLGYLGLFIYFAFGRLASAPLVTKNDPFLEESLHHHV